MDIINLFKCLGDKSRLKIIHSLMDGEKYVEILAESLELAPSTISFHLKKMEDAGLVKSKKDQYYVVYSLNEKILESTLKELLEDSSQHNDEFREKELAYKEGVLKSFFQYGKLKSIPVQRKKRIIILEEITKVFDTSKVYTEKEVNIAIADFHDDFCTIRKELVTEGFLERDHGIYRRVKEI